MKSMILALLTTLLSTSAFAGSLNYGCVGKTENGIRIFFNRDRLVAISDELVPSKLLTLQNDSIDSFESADSNSGFQKEMSFERVWGDGSKTKLTLKEVSTKSKSSKHQTTKCTGNRIRDIDYTTSETVYQIFFPNEMKPVKATLECYEHSVSACG